MQPDADAVRVDREKLEAAPELPFGAFHFDDESFGTPRLVETLVRARGGSVAEIEAELGAVLLLFTAGTPFGDDRTFVLLKRT